MRGSRNPRTGERYGLTSWKSFQDLGQGNFRARLLAIGIPQIFIWKNGSKTWRSGPWNGRVLTGVRNMYSVYLDGYSLVTENDGTLYMTRHQTTLTRTYLDANGALVHAVWDYEKVAWDQTWLAPADYCDVYNNCGPFGFCNAQNRPICNCLRGYEPKNKVEWDRGNWIEGCVKSSTPLQCQRDSNSTDQDKQDGFVKMALVKVPDFIE